MKASVVIFFIEIYYILTRKETLYLSTTVAVHWSQKKISKLHVPSCASC